ncbi:hypothetical protein D3C80_1747510 [compost metagenome]
MQQQGADMPGAVVGQDQVQVLDDRSADYFIRPCKPLSNKFIAACFTEFAQGVIAGQCRLVVQVQQQDSEPSIGEYTA